MSDRSKVNYDESSRRPAHMRLADAQTALEHKKAQFQKIILGLDRVVRDAVRYRQHQSVLIKLCFLAGSA